MNRIHKWVIRGYKRGSVGELDFWPYILPLPRSRVDQRRFLLTVFGSDTAMDILRSVSLDRKVYQRDLIKGLGYSNKTIIEKLKTLVALGVLEEGMDKSINGKKVVWLKRYTPTSLGKWIVFLLMPPERVDAGLMEKILVELFGLYVRNAVELCKSYGLNPNMLKTVFDGEIQSL